MEHNISLHADADPATPAPSGLRAHPCRVMKHDAFARLCGGGGPAYRSQHENDAPLPRALRLCVDMLLPPLQPSLPTSAARLRAHALRRSLVALSVGGGEDSEVRPPMAASSRVRRDSSAQMADMFRRETSRSFGAPR